MSKLQSVLKKEQPPGVYRLETTATTPSLKREAEAAGWILFSLDGNKMRSKAEFLERAGKACKFPAYYGKNWDAFEECINDLLWVPAEGSIFLIKDAQRFLENAPKDATTALNILTTTTANWTDQATPFYVVLTGNAPETYPEI